MHHTCVRDGNCMRTRPNIRTIFRSYCMQIAVYTPGTVSQGCAAETSSNDVTMRARNGVKQTNKRKMDGREPSLLYGLFFVPFSILAQKLYALVYALQCMQDSYTRSAVCISAHHQCQNRLKYLQVNKKYTYRNTSTYLNAG